MTLKTPELLHIQDPRKFFIIYRRASGKRFAEFLHNSLHALGVDVFLDDKDLKKGLSKKDWDEQRDKALRDSGVIIFILTQGAYASSQIKHELQLAIDNNKNPLPFVDEELWEKRKEKDTVIKLWEQEFKFKLNKEIIDITKKQLFTFKDETDLVRRVGNNILITQIIN